MLKISYTNCFGLSPAISAKFILKLCVTAQNRKKNTKAAYFGGFRVI